MAKDIPEDWERLDAAVDAAYDAVIQHCPITTDVLVSTSLTTRTVNENATFDPPPGRTAEFLYFFGREMSERGLTNHVTMQVREHHGSNHQLCYGPAEEREPEVQVN